MKTVCESILTRIALTERVTGEVVPATYFMFYAGGKLFFSHTSILLFTRTDWDSSAWMYNNLKNLWDDPNRGKVPIGWYGRYVISFRISFDQGSQHEQQGSLSRDL